MSYDKSTMQPFVQENRNLVPDLGYNEDYVVTTYEVRRAVSKLKAGKSESRYELSSDQFLYAGDDLFCHIALLLSAMIVHKYSPEQLTTSTVIPIPKGGI